MFELENPVEKKFGSFDETLAFVSEEKKRLVRIPISGLWKKGAAAFFKSAWPRLRQSKLNQQKTPLTTHSG